MPAASSIEAGAADGNLERSLHDLIMAKNYKKDYKERLEICQPTVAALKWLTLTVAALKLRIVSVQPSASLLLRILHSRLRI